jgi:O-antigen/teichoic acid export membrane protein
MSNTHAEEGKNRLIFNVFVGWGSYLVFIIVGFILPRMMDEHLGKELLGVWDFSWSIVNYIAISNIGLGAQTNRFVAEYLSIDRIDLVSEIVSTSFILQCLVSLIVLTATTLIVLNIGLVFSDSELEHTAQYTILFLGLSLAVQMLFDTAKGVLTGYHRWDLNSGINAASRVISMVLMIAAMYLDYGLVGIAVAYLIAIVITEVTRQLISIKIAKNTSHSIRLFKKKLAKKMFVYGLKGVVLSLPHLILIQSTNIVIGYTLGAASLAEFARPLALVKFIHSFINRYSFALTPIAGSLTKIRDSEEIKELILRSSRWGFSLTVPFIVFLVVSGDNLIRVWMGEDYVRSSVIIVLALGQFLVISNEPSLRILMGLNKHGKFSIYNIILVISLYIVVLSVVFSTGGPTLTNLAIAISLPLAIGYGVFQPIFTCSVLNVSKMEYLRYVAISPLIIGSIFFVILTLIDTYIANEYTLLGLDVVIGGVSLIIMYWFLLFDKENKQKIMNILHR